MDSSPDTSGSNRLRHATEIFAAYLQDSQDGLPDIDQLARRHPELAAELRALADSFELGQSLNSAQLHQQLGDTIEKQGKPTEQSPTPSQPTVDFENTHDLAESEPSASPDVTLESASGHVRPNRNVPITAPAPASSADEADRYEVIAQFARGWYGRFVSRSRSQTRPNVGDEGHAPRRRRYGVITRRDSNSVGSV